MTFTLTDRKQQFRYITKSAKFSTEIFQNNRDRYSKLGVSVKLAPKPSLHVHFVKNIIDTQHAKNLVMRVLVYIQAYLIKLVACRNVAVVVFINNAHTSSS